MGHSWSLFAVGDPVIKSPEALSVIKSPETLSGIKSPELMTNQVAYIPDLKRKMHFGEAGCSLVKRAARFGGGRLHGVVVWVSRNGENGNLLGRWHAQQPAVRFFFKMQDLQPGTRRTIYSRARKLRHVTFLAAPPSDDKNTPVAYDMQLQW